MKKIVSFILAITICTSILGAEFKEITPLEQPQIETAVQNVVQPEEKKVEEQPENKESVIVEEPKERIEDLGIKRKSTNGLVYAGKEETPYTGKFALFLGDIIEYTESAIKAELALKEQIAREEAAAKLAAEEEAARKAAEEAEKQAKIVKYKIKWGDTLWDIADSYYKNPWKYKTIAKYNGIKNPDYIISGTTISIPPM